MIGSRFALSRHMRIATGVLKGSLLTLVVVLGAGCGKHQAGCERRPRGSQSGTRGHRGQNGCACRTGAGAGPGSLSGQGNRFGGQAFSHPGGYRPASRHGAARAFGSGSGHQAQPAGRSLFRHAIGTRYEKRRIRIAGRHALLWTRHAGQALRPAEGPRRVGVAPRRRRLERPAI